MQLSKQANLRKLKPYGDIMDDGTVQLAFTLPVELSPEAREAAVQLVQKMGYDQIKVLKVDSEKKSREEIDELIRSQIGRKLVVLGACTGYDAHTVGIDAIIN